MTRYRVAHRTRYRYGAPVTTGLTIAHLLPRTTSRQTVQHASVTSEPIADHSHTHVDAFGNLTTFLAIERPHDQLEIVAASEVTIEPGPWPPGGLSAPPWDAVEGMLASDTTDEGLLARACRLESPLVAGSAELGDYATPSFPPGRPLDEAVRDLSRRIHHDFAFDPDFSDVATPLSEVLEARRGVCQDFAHLAIACLRSVGLPSRYVSGYLETEPPPGEARLVGADASHAWCATYAPGLGWLAMDPTNDLVPPDRHVVVAWGRDYADVAPVRGVVFGPATHQELTVAVDVVPC